MTGFGRATKEIGQKQITVEIRSVNHRYLELQTRLPDSLAPLDPKIRSLVRDSVTRGKTDLTIQIHKSKDANPNLTWDRGTAGFYYQAAKEIAEEYQIPFDLTATELLHLPDVIKYSCEEEDLDELFLEVKPVVEEALLDDAILDHNYLLEQYNDGNLLLCEIYDKHGLSYDCYVLNTNINNRVFLDMNTIKHSDDVFNLYASANDVRPLSDQANKNILSQPLEFIPLDRNECSDTNINEKVKK